MFFSNEDDHFALVLFEKGSGTHIIDAIEHRIAPYQVHLVFPERTHQWELNPGVIAHRLLIKTSYFQTAFAFTHLSAFNIRHQSIILLEQDSFQKILSELLLIRSELDRMPDFEDLVYFRCNIIISLLKRQPEVKFANQGLYKQDTLLHRFQALVEQHFREHKSVAFYAQQLNITPNYLSILCNRRFEISAQAIIQNRVIIEAQKLIKTQDLSIKEIAFVLGFNEPAYFSSFFKSKTGTTARQYKKQS